MEVENFSGFMLLSVSQAAKNKKKAFLFEFLSRFCLR